MSSDNGGVPHPSGKANPIDTDYTVGQDNVVLSVGPFGLDIHNRVFAVSGLAIVIFVFATLIFREQVEPLFLYLRSWLTSSLDWFFLLSGNIFVVVCLGLAISPLGRVRIGGTDATPDYSYSGWLAMLFAAGMGIGLVFFGVSEPMTHFTTALGAPHWKMVCVPTGHHWVVRWVIPKPHVRSVWQRRFTIGHFTLGQYTHCWLWDWLFSRSTKGYH